MNGAGQLMSQSSGLRYRASPAGEKNQAASGRGQKMSSIFFFSCTKHTTKGLFISMLGGFHRFFVGF